MISQIKKHYEAMLSVGMTSRYVIVEAVNIGQAYSEAVLLCDKDEHVRGVNELDTTGRNDA